MALGRLRVYGGALALAVLSLRCATNREALVPSEDGCDPTLWNYVHRPARLKMIESCKTVTGVITNIHVSGDGDYHILLRPDPQYAHLLNKVNIGEVDGCLVTEPVCQHPILKYSQKVCWKYRGMVPLPRVGDYVSTTGSYVLDAPHGWMEIHPVTSIVILSRPK